MPKGQPEEPEVAPSAAHGIPHTVKAFAAQGLQGWQDYRPHGHRLVCCECVRDAPTAWGATDNRMEDSVARIQNRGIGDTACVHLKKKIGRGHRCKAPRDVARADSQGLPEADPGAAGRWVAGTS